MNLFTRGEKLSVLVSCLLAAELLVTFAVLSATGVFRAGTPHCTGRNYAMQCVHAPAPSQAQLFLLRPAVASGIDFAWSCPSPRGHGFGASYLSTDSSKNWTKGCVAAWARAGAARVFVWETTATRALAGCVAGRVDARAAWAQGRAFAARVVFLAVDFQLQASQASQVLSYFRCAGQAIGIARLGGYGGYETIRRLFDAHLVRYGWQTYAWSFGLWDGRAQLQQWLNGNAFDLDRAVARDYGQTPYTVPVPKPRPKPKPKPRHHREALVAYWRAERTATLRRYRAHGCSLLDVRPACRYWRIREHLLWRDISHG